MSSHRARPARLIPAAVPAAAMTLLLLVGTLCATTSAADSADDVVVFQSGKDGYHTYRIPALVVTPGGALLAICEGRKTSRADHGDVDLVQRRSTDGGRTWGPLTRIHEEGGDAPITIGNPCPVVDRETGVLWLPFTRDNNDVFVISSRDDGKTWSEPRRITADVKDDDWTWYATGPGNGIQPARGKYRGRLVIPCDHRVREISDRRQSTRSHIIYSDDHGRTWHRGGATDFRMNECAVIERENGDLLLNMRSNRGRGCRAVAVSDDGGVTWSECRDATELIEPVCQASMIRINFAQGDKRGRLAFCNPASSTARKQLTLRLSYDDGESWPRSKLLHAGSAAYCSLALLPSETHLGVLYERRDYGEIALARVALASMEAP